MTRRSTPRRGFSLTEMMVVIGVVAVILGLLFPALGAFRRSGLMTKSMSNMRQIGAWMNLYSSDNRDFIVPSQFDYNFTSGCQVNTGYKGKVRSVIQQQPQIGEHHAGTWADILWTVNGLGPFPELSPPYPDGLGFDYSYDSPDTEFYRWMSRNVGKDFENPLRSAAPNTRNYSKSIHNLPTPYGAGASEAGYPGYFAANNFFNADCDCQDFDGNPTYQGWYTRGQIRVPERSMYLVDSFAGEVIEDQPEPYLVHAADDFRPTLQVDFRYSNVCLMLFLDSHIESLEPWDELDDLEGGTSDAPGKGLRIRDLTSRTPPPPAG